MKRINVKLLITLIAVTFGFGIATVLLHEFQQNRRADGLLERVDQLHDEKRFEDAIKLQQMYCFRRPDDHAALAKLAPLMKEAFENHRNESDLPLDPKTVQQTFLMLEKAIRRNPEDRTLLEAAIDVDMRLRRFPDAIVHLEHLIDMETADDDAKFRVKLASCYMLSGNEADSVALLKQLIGYDEVKKSFRPDQAVAPKEIDAYLQLAILYEQKQDVDMADAVFEQMTVANPESEKAWMNRAMFAKTARQDGIAATKFMDRAVEIAPEDEEILRVAGQLAMQDQQFDRGKSLFEKLRTINPKNPHAYHGLATWSTARRDYSGALDYINQGLEQSPDEFQLLWQKANIELEMGRLDQTEKTIVQLRELNVHEYLLEFLKGRIHIAKREWLEASNKLAGVRHVIAQFRPEWVNSLDMSLAACYEQLGKNDLRLEVIDRVLAADPKNISMRLGKAQALASLNQTQRAIDEYDELQRLVPDISILPPTTLGAFFDLELMKQLSRDEAGRNWQQAESLVQRIAKSPSVPRSVVGKIMERFFRASGQVERADKVFETILAQNPNSLQLQVDKVYRESLSPNGFESSMAELEQLRKKHGDLVEFRLLEANMLVANRVPNFLTRLADLEKDTDQYGDPQRTELFFQLGRYYLSEREFDQARRLWMKVSDLRPTDIEHAVRLFELDIVSNRIQEAELSVERIASIVTRDGSEYKWAKAAPITLEVQSTARPKADLGEALALVNEAISSRGNWEAPYRLRGEIHTLSRQFDAAIESFERAIEVGSSNAEVFKRLARLYYDKGKYRKCKDMYERLPSNQWESTDQQINLAVMSQLGELPKELSYDRESKEPGYHLQMGTILSNAKRFDDAQVAFQRAVELGPNNSDAWGALFENFLRQDKKDEANQILEKAKSTIAADNLPRFLASSYQLLGEWDKSEEFYQQAIKAAPDDQRLLQSLAQLYLISGRTKEAIGILEQMVKIEPPHLESPQDTVAWARRALASVVSRSQTYVDFQRAMALVEDNAPEGAILGSSDLVQWAQLSAGRPDPAIHRMAIKKLQTASDERGLNDDEKLVLAELYKRQGKWSQCKSVMLDLLANHANDTRYITPWLTWLIDVKDYDQAEKFVSKLPADSMMAVRTTAHIFASRGKTDEAVRAVAAPMPKNATKKDIAQVMGIGAVLEELGSFDKRAYRFAERVWQRVAQLEPERVIQLAAYYNRRDDKESAIKALAAAKQYFDLGTAQKTGAMQVVVRIVRDHYPQIGKDSSVEDSVRQLFETATAEQPENGTMLVLRSEFEELMGKSDDAERFLRQYSEKPGTNPRDRAVVLNNLAYRLAIHGDADESAQLVEDAEKLLGPRPDLRDTKGMVFLAQKNFKDAIAEFQASIEAGGPGAIQYFHLALAYWQNGDKKEAIAAITDSRNMDIDKMQMTGFERQQYIDLLRDMKSDGVQLEEVLGN